MSKRVWVDDNFHKKLKSEAAAEEESILELTKRLAQDSEEHNQKQKKRGRSFDFKIF